MDQNLRRATFVLAARPMRRPAAVAPLIHQAPTVRCDAKVLTELMQPTIDTWREVWNVLAMRCEINRQVATVPAGIFCAFNGQALPAPLDQ